MNIINQNWEGSAPVPNVYSYATGNATAAKSIQAGAGVSGSEALVLDSTFGTGNAIAGVQLATTSNPNLTISDPNLVTITFDIRASTTARVLGNIYLYVQTWSGVYSGQTDGTWGVRFNPTPGFSTESFNLGALQHVSGTVIPTHQTLQLSWQLDSFSGWAQGQHTLAIDNIRVTAVPEPDAVALLVGAGLSGAGFLFRRRRKQA